METTPTSESNLPEGAFAAINQVLSGLNLPQAHNFSIYLLEKDEVAGTYRLELTAPHLCNGRVHVRLSKSPDGCSAELVE